MAAIALSARSNPIAIPGRHVLRLTRDALLPHADRSCHARLLSDELPDPPDLEGYPLLLSFGRSLRNAISLPPTLDYLDEGDIVRVTPSRGEVKVLYRKRSRHNVLFITENCNSRCVMCSQPPRDIEDGYLVGEILQAIPLMSKDTPQLCITGGEPTLHFSGLVSIIDSLRHNLPTTPLHMLSNGRLFSQTSHAKTIASVGHPNFTIGIPLYSDQPSGHDYIVQSEGAFDQTILGLLNLARYGQRVEIRFVIHRESLHRMTATAKFIARNLPFARHVALMGLEPIGFGKTNFEALWIDPREYQLELTETVEILRQAGLRTSIYNHQLCTLPRPLWPLAIKSISDWKNIYFAPCDSCSVLERCCGFFSSASGKQGVTVRPVNGEREATQWSL